MKFKKEKQWYAIQTPDHGPRIYYRIKNRVLAFFSLCLLFGTGAFYIIYLEEKPDMIPALLFGTLLLFLLIMSCLADSFDFYLKKQLLIRIRGVFPFISKQTIPFSDISTIRLEEIKQDPKAKRLYGLSIILTGGKQFYTGCFRDKDKLISAFEQIGSIEVID